MLVGIPLSRLAKDIYNCKPQKCIRVDYKGMPNFVKVNFQLDWHDGIWHPDHFYLIEISTELEAVLLNAEETDA